MENLLPHQVLSLTGRRWHWPALPLNPDFAHSHGLPPWVGALLEQRGVAGEEAVNRYLEPSLTTLEDPHSMADMPAALERLMGALERREPMVVYGDYDVDGVCSTAVLVEFLRGVGGNVAFYIPDRRAEGYGLNGAAIKDLATRAKLIITADCGVTAVEEIALARRHGADVLVVDHHQCPEHMPAAVACLNPHRPDCAFAFKGLCAAGVAFMLVVALRRALRERGAFATRPEPDVRALLDMVAVATVADMVPIHGTNRVLVAAGLRRLAQAPRPGLAALCAVAKIPPGKCTATDLGFRLGPRINARGRMSQAGLAVDLMLCRDPLQAETMAATLDAANEERRQVEKTTVDAAIAQVLDLNLSHDAMLVVHDCGWHPGVLGLVASRLVGRFHRPALVIGEGGKGSGRSVEGLNLHAALTRAAAWMVRFGGHPMAAGVTVTADNIAPLRAALAADVQQQLGAPPFAPILRPDLEVTAAMLNLDTVGTVQRLAPFGQGNPEPLFVARGLPVTHKRLVGERHLKLRFGAHADGIAFGLGELLGELPSTVDVAFHLERNEWQGRVSVQMRVQDMRAAES